MRRLSRTGVAAAVSVAALVFSVSHAAAAPGLERNVPVAGLGSAKDPLTVDHGSIDVLGVWLPVFRFVDPCAEHPAAFTSGQEVMAWTGVDAGRFASRQLSRPAEGSVQEKVTLRCAKVSVPAFAQETVQTPCPRVMREIPPYAPSLHRTSIARSLAYHHAAGPILLPGGTVGGGSLSFTNIGWVTAHVNVWWLCE